MTSYQHAWLTLIQQRDTFYLELLFAVLVGLSWHWLGKKFICPVIIDRIALGGSALLVGLGLAWGFIGPR
jgi:hypothetical protein